MKVRLHWLFIVVAVAVLCMAGWTVFAQRETSSPGSKVVWEYKTVRGHRALSEGMLNDMGMHGWELVMFDDGERGNGSYSATYYFKRVK